MKEFFMRHPVATVFLAVLGYGVVADGYTLVDRHLRRRHQMTMLKNGFAIPKKKDNTTDDKEEGS